MKKIKVDYGRFETEQLVDESIYDAIYNKAIDDFKAECYKQISKNQEKYGFRYIDLDEAVIIAKQLKKDGKNRMLKQLEKDTDKLLEIATAICWNSYDYHKDLYEIKKSISDLIN